MTGKHTPTAGPVMSPMFSTIVQIKVQITGQEISAMLESLMPSDLAAAGLEVIDRPDQSCLIVVRKVDSGRPKRYEIHYSDFVRSLGAQVSDRELGADRVLQLNPQGILLIIERAIEAGRFVMRGAA